MPVDAESVDVDVSVDSVEVESLEVEVELTTSSEVITCVESLTPESVLEELEDDEFCA